jgi:hypothetical protein
MNKERKSTESDKDPNRYIVWEGPNAESLQFWEDEWHDRHDDMSREGHKACLDCSHDLTDWPG